MAAEEMENEEKMREMFDAADVDGTGTISMGEAVAIYVASRDSDDADGAIAEASGFQSEFMLMMQGADLGQVSSEEGFIIMNLGSGGTLCVCGTANGWLCVCVVG